MLRFSQSSRNRKFTNPALRMGFKSLETFPESFQLSNICGIQSSLEEAFEFRWSSLADKHNTLPKSTPRHGQIYIWNPMTTRFIIKTLLCVISMEFLPLSRGRSSPKNVPSGEERGETDVFAGSEKVKQIEINITLAFTHVSLVK